MNHPSRFEAIERPGESWAIRDNETGVVHNVLAWDWLRRSGRMKMVRGCRLSEAQIHPYVNDAFNRHLKAQD